MGLAGLLDAGGRGGEVGSRLAASFSRGLAQGRFDESLAFQPFECGVDAGEGDLPAALFGNIPRDEDPIGVTSRAHDRQQQHQLDRKSVV